MKTENIPGYIIWLKDLKSGNEHSNLVFSADVDFVTTGMISLTSFSKNEIVVSMLNPQEFYESNYGWVKRINFELNRDDLRYIELKRIDEFNQKKKLFESYKNYWKRLKPSKKYYRDISDDSSELLEIRKDSISVYIEKGGNILFHKFD